MDYINNNKNYTDPFLKGTDIFELISLLSDYFENKNSFKFNNVILYFESGIIINYDSNNSRCILSGSGLKLNGSDLISIELLTLKNLYNFINFLKHELIKSDLRINFNDKLYSFNHFKIFF